MNHLGALRQNSGYIRLCRHICILCSFCNLRRLFVRLFAFKSGFHCVVSVDNHGQEMVFDCLNRFKRSTSHLSVPAPYSERRLLSELRVWNPRHVGWMYVHLWSKYRGFNSLRRIVVQVHQMSITPIHGCKAIPWTFGVMIRGLGIYVMIRWIWMVWDTVGSLYEHVIC